jgi:transcriptional regulator with XRE-family HTH domain
LASNPKAVDVHVGSRVRLRRTLLGMSQEKLGDAVGLTFQQIQKYERGANRIGSSRLYQFSQVLDVPVSFFFDDMPPEVTGGRRVSGDGGEAPERTDQFTKRETLELVRAYYRIGEPAIRKRVFDLVKAIAATGAPPEL